MSAAIKGCHCLAWLVIMSLLASSIFAQRGRHRFRKQFLENKARTVRLVGSKTYCTGFIVETNLVLTAYHCTGERLKYLNYPAEIANSDPEHDLALYATRTARFDPIPIGDPQRYEDVYTFGYHDRHGKSYSSGTLPWVLDFLVSTVDVHPGDSGSGLFNERDELIGIMVRADFNSYATKADYIRCVIRPTVACESAKEK